MTPSLSYTERSWGIDLISEINTWARGRKLPIRKATGEEGLKQKSTDQTVFPDLLLRGASDEIIMGWELKLPNTSSHDVETVENAKMKADRMGTNSFLIWNVNEAVLHVRDSLDSWRIAQTFPLPKMIEHTSVKHHRELWLDLLYRILSGVSARYLNKEIRDADIAFILGEPTYRAVLELCSEGQALQLKQAAIDNRIFGAQVKRWLDESTTSKTENLKQDRLTLSHYQLLGDVLIVNWLNKILFCHYLKVSSEAAFDIDALGPNASVDDFLNCFERISDDSDFKSIFRPVLGQGITTPLLLSQLRQVNSLLKESTGNVGGDFDLSQSLAGGMGYLRGKESGQFSTPPLLARLLTSISVTRTAGHIIDPCSGSGTIARAAFSLKLENLETAAEAARTVWASDKFSIPLGFTGIALAHPQAMGEVQQVFLSDVSNLRTGQRISFVDPVTGSSTTRDLPLFDTIVSNLPFVRFESIPESQDRARLKGFANSENSAVSLSGKSDLYAYIILGLRHLVTHNARIGVITSNSWLGTDWGEHFLRLLRQHYHIHILLSSSTGRWFSNASTITVIMVLSLKSTAATDAATQIVTTDLPIESWTPDWVDDVSNALLVSDSTEGLTSSSLNDSELDTFISAGIYLPAIAGHRSLLQSLIESTSPIQDFFTLKRGNRPGAERDLHFLSPKKALSAGIEEDYLVPLFHDPKSAFAGQPLAGIPPNYYFFMCYRSIDELRSLNHTGALRYISSVSTMRNSKGQLLPNVLKGKPYWYSPATPVRADLLTQLAPFKRYGVYSPKNDQFPVSQRFAAFNAKKGVDVELAHALLNSTLSYFWQEVTSFPKGEGALDRNPTGMEKRIRIPDLTQFDNASRTRILDAFGPLARREALDFDEEITQLDRRAFDEVVIKESSIKVDLAELYEAFVSVVFARTSVAL